MKEKLIKELELLRDYNQKGNLEPRLKLLIDYIDELEKENFNLREDTYIEKMSFPSEGRNIKELMEMPTYQELQEENKRLREVTTDTYESSQEIIGELTKENKELHNKIDEISDFIKENKIKRYRPIEGEEYDEEIVLDEDDITCLERIINDEYDYENR